MGSISIEWIQCNANDSVHASYFDFSFPHHCLIPDPWLPSAPKTVYQLGNTQSCEMASKHKLGHSSKLERQLLVWVVGLITNILG